MHLEFGARLKRAAREIGMNNRRYCQKYFAGTVMATQAETLVDKTEISTSLTASPRSPLGPMAPKPDPGDPFQG